MTQEIKQLVETVESLADVASSVSKPGGKARTTSGKEALSLQSSHAGRERCRLLRQLAVELRKLDHLPSGVDEFFITNVCYQLMESAGIIVSDYDLQDSIFSVIGVCVERFNHGYQCALRLFQIIQGFDKSIACVARCLNFLVTDGINHVNVPSELFQFIITYKPEVLQQDGTVCKNICLLFSELSEKFPGVWAALLSIFDDNSEPTLIELLGRDPYSLRNAILTAIASVVIHLHALSAATEDSESLRMTLDGFIDHIANHSRDKNAFVRAKVVQILETLINVKTSAISLERHIEFLELTNNMLLDKSSFVRRHAIGLACSLLENAHLAIKLAETSERDEEVELKESISIGLAKFRQFGTNFAHIFRSKTLENIMILMQSKTASDLSEALSLLCLAADIGVEMESLLPLSFDVLLDTESDQSLKDDVLRAFDHIYIEGRNSSQILESSLRVMSKIESFSDLDGLGQVFIELYKSNKLPHGFFAEVIRQISSLNVSTNVTLQRRLALLVALISLARPPPLVKAIDIIVHTFRETTDVVLKGIFVDILRNLLSGSSHRLDWNHLTVVSMEKALTDCFTTASGNKNWFCLFRSVVLYVYEVCNKPDAIAGNILKNIYLTISRSSGENFDAATSLSRFILAAGEIGLREYVHLDGTVYKFLKVSSSHAKDDSSKNTSGDNTVNDSGNELEMAFGIGGRQDTAVLDLISVLLSGIIGDRSCLLSQFISVIADAVEQTENVELSCIALLSALKLMLVSELAASSKLVETVIERSRQVLLSTASIPLEDTCELKTAVLIGLTDLSVRWPNLSERLQLARNVMYPLLVSSQVELRRVTITIVGYLALNDLLRVKDHLADITVIASSDMDDLARELARDLLFDLAKKGDEPLMKALPNILRRLSTTIGSATLVQSDVQFMEISEFLFKLVAVKEKQTEKLLHCLLSQLEDCGPVKSSADDSGQRYRLASCLQLINIAPKSVSVFQEHLGGLSELIQQDNKVHDSITQALQSLKSSMERIAEGGSDAETSGRDQLVELLDVIAAVRGGEPHQVLASSNSENHRKTKSARSVRGRRGAFGASIQTTVTPAADPDDESVNAKTGLPQLSTVTKLVTAKSSSTTSARTKTKKRAAIVEEEEDDG